MTDLQMISMSGLKRPSLLAQRLSDIASDALPAELKTSPIDTRELTLGIGMVVPFAVLLALSWDLKELWWIWLLLLVGSMTNFQAVSSVRLSNDHRSHPRQRHFWVRYIRGLRATIDTSVEEG